jgi:hypothetical protein
MSADLLPAPSSTVDRAGSPWIDRHGEADGLLRSFELPGSTYLSAMVGLGLRRALARPAFVAPDGAEPTVRTAAAHRWDLVQDLGMPATLRQLVVDAYLAMGDGVEVPVLVRRSGTLGTSDHVVVGAEAVVDEIVALWASLWDEETVERQRRGDLVEPAVAVEVACVANRR